MCCYFAALTPIHALWHWQEESEISKKATENHHSETDCYYCSVLISGANSHLVSDFSLEIVSKIFFIYKEIIFENPLYNPSFYEVNFSLRAPPIF